MAENYNGQAPAAPVESTDRGLFDFGKKKDDVKVHETVQDQHEEGKHHDSLLKKFHHADDKHHNSSSSSSDEEDSEEKKQRKREKKEKKGLKEKIVEKLPGHRNDVNTGVPVSKPYKEEPAYFDNTNGETTHLEGDNVEKKGLLEKIKDKFSGEKKVEEHKRDMVAPEVEGEEKKGFVEKIKEKIHGHGDVDAEEKKRVHV